MTRIRSIGVTTTAIIVASVFSAVALTRAQQRDPRAAVPAVTPVAMPTGTGAVSGVVTNEDGSRPVRFAYVLIIGAAKGVGRATSTDGDGRFLFAGLPADHYIVGASKPPYLGAMAGARRPAHMGTPIALAEGQKITNVAVRLPLGAVITGTIMDEKGQPAQAVIGIYQWRMYGGERVAMAVSGDNIGGNLTDDRGRYRIYGLAPGDYLIAASSLRLSAPLRTLSVSEVDEALRTGAAPPGPAAGANQRYTPAFFPGTTRASDALAVTVGTGEERSGVDFKLQVVTTARVTGVVTSSDGQLPQRMAVSLRPSVSTAMQGTMGAAVQPDGTFVFQSVMPGSYLLQATGGGQPSALAGFADVDVAGADVTGIQLALRPGVTLSGSVMYRGQSAPPATNLRLPLSPTKLVLGLSPSLQMGSDGVSFTIVNIFPGSYYAKVSVSGLAPDATWTVESIVLDGKDVTDLLVEVAAENPPKTIAVTFTDRFQELSGQIRRADGTPASEHTIVVFPESKEYWLTGSRRIVVVRPATDGRFTVSGAGSATLPPGRYLMAAVVDIDRDEQYDPAFLSALVPAAVPVTLQPGEKKVQDLVVR